MRDISKIRTIEQIQLEVEKIKILTSTLDKPLPSTARNMLNQVVDDLDEILEFLKRLLE